MSKRETIFLGWDSRERDAWAVARYTLLHHLKRPVPVKTLSLGALYEQGLYSRPTKNTANGRLIDVLSARPGYDGQMSTEHANARFFVPYLAGRKGWALFADGDVLFRDDVSEVFNFLDERKALYCVKHEHRPIGTKKMDGCVQTRYERKNWSSFMIFNCDHPANQYPRFDLDLLNQRPGRDLHGFCWLHDDEIGSLDLRWNYLVGHNDANQCSNPIMVHFTSGVPDMPGYENCEYADEWRKMRDYYLGQMSAELGVGKTNEEGERRNGCQTNGCQDDPKPPENGGAEGARRALHDATGNAAS